LSPWGRSQDLQRGKGRNAARFLYIVVEGREGKKKTRAVLKSYHQEKEEKGKGSDLPDFCDKRGVALDA